MRKRKAALILALSLTLALTLGIAAQAVDLEAANTLTVAATGDTSYAENITSADVVLDLYKLADAIRAEGYDTYSYDFAEAYGMLALEGMDLSRVNLGSVSLTNEQWQELAQQAAEIALDSGEPTIEGAETGARIEDLSAGLYLVIARGGDMTSPEDYRRTVENDEGEESIVTIARSAEYEYCFAPSLVSLPTKDDMDGDGAVNTAYGEWTNEVQITLKPVPRPLYGSVEIVKAVDDFTGAEEATFVFRVTANGNFVDDEEYVYSNVVAVSMNGAAPKSASVSGIRAGAKVTVEEIYTGPRYDAGGVTAPESTTVVADDVITFRAVNTMNTSGNGGHGIQNHFVKGEDGRVQDPVEQQTAANS